jgi:hypothetical protein
MSDLKKPLFSAKATQGGMIARILAPIGTDIAGALVMSYMDVNAMTDDNWQELLSTLTVKSNDANLPVEVRQRYADRVRYVKNLMRAIGYDANFAKPPMSDMSNMDIIEEVFTNPILAEDAATRFIESSDTDKKRVVKYLESYKKTEPLRSKRQAEIIDDSLFIQYPWLLVTQKNLDLIMLRENLSGMKHKTPEIKSVIDFIDNELKFRKTENMTLKNIETSCDLVKLKEARERITAYLASTVKYFKDDEFIRTAMENDSYLKPLHLYAGRLLKHVNKLAEQITNRIQELSLADNDNRFTVQINVCTNRLNAYWKQLNEWFVGNPSKKYSVELAYIMPAIKSVHDTLKNMYDLYIWYENRLGKDKSEFKISTCPELEKVDASRVKKINRMSFAELREAFDKVEGKYNIEAFSDVKKIYGNEMEYIRRVIRERVRYIQESDTAIPKQNVKVITAYTEAVADTIKVLNSYMSKIYDRINNLNTIEMNDKTQIETLLKSKFKANENKYKESNLDKTYRSNQLDDYINSSGNTIVNGHGLSARIAEIAQIPQDTTELDNDLQNLLAGMAGVMQGIMSIQTRSVIAN